MFTIRISLRQNEDDITGLDALDERRRLKLQDGSIIRTGYGHTSWRQTETTESVAREYFNRTQEIDTVEIPLALLTPNDVYEEVYPQVLLRKDLTSEHINRLYLTYKMWEITNPQNSA